MDEPIIQNMAFIGEVGLGGEVRTVPHLEQREKEAKKLGYKLYVMPGSKQKNCIRYLHEAIKKALR